MAESEQLKLERIIGFNGTVPNGLNVHPDGDHLIYPFAKNIIIEDISSNSYGPQSILSKHTDDISCLSVSPNGTYLASGQVTERGFKAPIIIWDYARKQALHEGKIHGDKVEAVTFSFNEKYLISLGGQHSVVIWDVKTGDPIAGTWLKTPDLVSCVCTSDMDENTFVTDGESLSILTLDVENRKVIRRYINLSGIKRTVTCMQVSKGFLYCGTTTGDILVVSMPTAQLIFEVPVREKFNLGVTSLAITDKSHLIVGTGDGILANCTIDFTNKELTVFQKWQDTEKSRALTSIALTASNHKFFVGSEGSAIYTFKEDDSAHVLQKRFSLSKRVHDLTVLCNTSELIITCGDGEIGVWHRETLGKVKRFTFVNKSCNAIDITADGTKIITGWSDGTIQVYDFGLETLEVRLKYSAVDAHIEGVTAIACTTDGRKIVSGDEEGEIRVWRFEEHSLIENSQSAQLVREASAKEHKEAVTAIKILNNEDKECVTASQDGTCFIWNLGKSMQKRIIFANQRLQCVVYSHDGLHVITGDTSGKLAYWETKDGSLVAEFDGAKTGAINALDISPDGKYFVSGGDEKLLKVWRYNEREVIHVGTGHSAPIKKVCFTQNQRSIISVDTDGAILIWKFSN